MTTTRSVCLSLELDFEGERVTGWLADEHGNDWAFSSWLDLLSVIDRVLTSTGSLAATTNAPGRRAGSRAPSRLSTPSLRGGGQPPAFSSNKLSDTEGNSETMGVHGRG